MSKSLKNVINPDEVVKQYGADSVRMYEMFMGPLEVSKPWSTQGLIGVHRFLERVWALAEGNTNASGSTELTKLYHKTVKKVSEDTASLNFNTAISAMMIFINEATKAKSVPRDLWEGFVKLISVYAPHLGEELWSRLGHTQSIAYETWPAFDAALCVDDTATIVVQVNGKIRDKFDTPLDTPKEQLEKLALATAGAQKFIDGKPPKKVIVVPNKLVNVVV
jgi:leucyl-tRNA synthetase